MNQPNFLYSPNSTNLLVYGRGVPGLEGRKALLSVTTSTWENEAEGRRHVTAELSHVTGQHAGPGQAGSA